GACTGNDLCVTVTCVTAPAPLCTDPSTLTTYSSSGICARGNCTYPSATTPCADGCEGGGGKGDACAGVTCNQPPEAICDGSTGVRAFTGPGACAGGKCQYPSTVTPCSAPANATPTCGDATCGFRCVGAYQRVESLCVAPGTCPPDMTRVTQSPAF